MQLVLVINLYINLGKTFYQNERKNSRQANTQENLKPVHPINAH
jgi:hypothetical protein